MVVRAHGVRVCVHATSWNVGDRRIELLKIRQRLQVRDVGAHPQEPPVSSFAPALVDLDVPVGSPNAKPLEQHLISPRGIQQGWREEIRDNILSVTGQLNLKMGGESFYSKLDEAVLATSSTKGGKWGNSSPEERNRRAVYIKIKRSLKDPMLQGFDFADTDAPCPQRFTTTVATQALNLLNSNFVNDKAAIFAKRLEDEVDGDITDRITRGLEIVTSKPANPKSVEIAREMVKTLKNDHGLDEQSALQRFCLVALNMNEFIFVD